MTYLFKLVRRLAISRSSVTLPVLALLAACAGDSTSPNGETGTVAGEPAVMQVFPRSVTVETSQLVQFRGQARTLEGRFVETSLVWTASGGSIGPDGSFSASAAGMYRIFARGRGWKHSDTALVHVVPPQPKVVRLVVAPRPITVETGATRVFTASAFLDDGSPVQLGVNWSATGGTIDAAGTYTADTVPGAYHVIATNTAGTVADTAGVTVVTTVVGSSPTPGTPVLPTHARVIVTPATASLARGARQRFSAYGRSATGDSVALRITYKVTGGTITRGGLYTAGQKAGSYRVIATAGGMADTALVSLATSGTPAPTPTPVPAPTPTPAQPPIYTGRLGVPFGAFSLISSGVSATSYSMSMDGYTAGNIVSRLTQARASKMHVLMNMTGGDHNQYITGGTFDLSKWQAKMNSYNTPAIKAAVAAAVADGTIIGNSVMDEPQNTTPGKAWGPAGTMTKAKVDQLCGYVKAIFPTMPVGVVHDHRAVEPEKNYQVCDFLVSQYRLAKAPISEFREGGLAFAKRSGMAIAFSLNVLHGGTPGTACPKYGTDPSGVLCPMSPAQIKEFGQALGTGSCALAMWRYEREYFERSDIQAAFKLVADYLATLPRKGCVRS